jgi:AhpD family alkylhydroperoxidase
MKKLQFEEGPIPNKYRELIGVAVSAATKCRYCSFFHTEMAKLNGATEEEIEDAVHYAKSSEGWSTYINGLQMDEEQFKEEVLAACDYVRSKQGGEKELSCRDVGVDCDFVARGKSEEEILRKTAEHARKEHGMKEISREMEKKVRAAIHAAA